MKSRETQIKSWIKDVVAEPIPHADSLGPSPEKKEKDVLNEYLYEYKKIVEKELENSINKTNKEGKRSFIFYPYVSAGNFARLKGFTGYPEYDKALELFGDTNTTFIDGTLTSLGYRLSKTQNDGGITISW